MPFSRLGADYRARKSALADGPAPGPAGPLGRRLHRAARTERTEVPVLAPDLGPSDQGLRLLAFRRPRRLS